MKQLTDIQTSLNAPKNQRNKFGGYNYRKCEDILNALKPLLRQHQCAITLTDDILLIGQRYYVRATATLTNAQGDTATATAYAREEQVKKGMDEAQITGAASSYARKYALCGLLAIDDSRDPDTYNPAINQPQTPTNAAAPNAAAAPTAQAAANAAAPLQAPAATPVAPAAPGPGGPGADAPTLAQAIARIQAAPDLATLRAIAIELNPLFAQVPAFVDAGKARQDQLRAQAPTA